MKKNHVFIVLTYGLFLGWLLSFPYNGPVLKQLITAHGVSIASYSLIYTLVPALFLTGYVFLPIKERYAKPMMIWSIALCFMGTGLLFTVEPALWYPVFIVLGIGSVLSIIGWSYFYTMEIPVEQKMPVMALVIMTGNIIFYVVNIVYQRIPSSILLMILFLLLAGSFWTGLKLQVQEKIDIPLEKQPLPAKLIMSLCLFLFVINLTGGLTLHAINPSLDQQFLKVSTYYGILPYVLTLLVFIIFGRKASSLFPIFLGTSLLGMAYLSYGLMGAGLAGYFVTETFLQIGWALLDLILWTLFGLVASVYGRPLKICGFAFLANLSAVFAGGLLGVYLRNTVENYYLISAALAISIIFISVLIVHWLNHAIERDLQAVLWRRVPPQEPESEPESEPEPQAVSEQKQVVSWQEDLPLLEQLTPREREIAGLLLQGYTNKQIAAALDISENTMKTHSRRIYAKLNVANKRELMQLAHGVISSKNAT